MSGREKTGKSREKRSGSREKIISLPVKSRRQVMNTELENLVSIYRKLGIDRQIDYDKFYLYSIITHSTAIEGSTITEVENQIMFDHGISLKGKSIEEQNMNLDLRVAYERSIQLAAEHAPVTVDMLKELSALVMKNTGKEYKTALGDFSSARGELRLLNVTAGIGGRSYMNYNKVPAKLAEFCTRLNEERANCGGKSIYDLYILSFDAHYNLVTIHPWADGNGRMARLLMNQLQFEFGLIPTKILNEDKEEYIKSLVATRENDDLNIFRDFMVSTMVKNLVHDIEAYRNSIDDNESSEKVLRDGEKTGKVGRKTQKSGEKRPGSREKIVELLSRDGSLTAVALAARIGITPKAVEKQIARLKADGLIERIGPDKGGHWHVIGK